MSVTGLVCTVLYCTPLTSTTVWEKVNKLQDECDLQFHSYSIPFLFSIEESNRRKLLYFQSLVALKILNNNECEIVLN